MARVPSRSSTAQLARIEEWLGQKAHRAVMALPDDPELSSIKELCQSILEEGREFFSELNAFLAAEEEQAHSKRELLFHKWSERVFNPIHTHLLSKMDGPAYREMDRCKRKLFDRYLSYRNNKNVFLDTISPEEYDPLLSNSNTLMVRTGVLDDPLLRHDNSEELVVKGAPLGESPPGLGRGDTDGVLWLTMQLVHIDSSARKRSRLRMVGERNSSTFNSSADAGTDVLASQELQIPHKKPIHYNRTPFDLSWKEDTSS